MAIGGQPIVLWDNVFLAGLGMRERGERCGALIGEAVW